MHLIYGTLHSFGSSYLYDVTRCGAIQHDELIIRLKRRVIDMCLLTVDSCVSHAR